MKQILLILTLLLLIGCKRAQINTYYGCFNIDSLRYILNEDLKFYAIHNIESETVYYNPKTNKYLIGFKSHIGYSIAPFNPYTWTQDSIDYMKLMKKKYGKNVTYKETLYPD